MSGEIRKLSTHFRKNGYDYELVSRTQKKAIFRQSFEGRGVAFEVIKIRVRGSRPNLFTGKIDPPTEVYPGSEQFGKIAWAIVDREKAMEKYKSLKDE